jgi:hypothetical protein
MVLLNSLLSFLLVDQPLVGLDETTLSAQPAKEVSQERRVTCPSWSEAVFFPFKCSL